MYFVQDSQETYNEYKKKIQGEIFAISSEYGLDSNDFIKTFLGSKYAESMERSDGSRYWLMSPKYTIGCFLDDYNIKKGKHYRKDEMEWLGRQYRELALKSTSKEALKKDPSKLLENYKLYL